MKNFVPRLINGAVIFVAGGLAVVAGEAFLITKAAGKITDSDIVEGALIPSIKNYIFDGIEKAFFGTTRRSRDNSRATKPYFSYRDEHKEYLRKYGVEFCFKTESDACGFFRNMRNLMHQYGGVTYRDAKQNYIGYTCDYTCEISPEDSDMGWFYPSDIADMYQDGNVVILPKPERRRA